MPRYFFHLRFGQRFVPDEEGIDLPSRSAAREEAMAAVRDLTAKIGGNSRRWASWFIEVGDEQGGFFRTPIGYPALELVTPDLLERRAEQRVPIPPAASAPAQAAARGRVADIVREITTRRAHSAQLVEVNQRLRDELWSVYRATEDIRARTSRLVSLARSASR